MNLPSLQSITKWLPGRSFVIAVILLNIVVYGLTGVSLYQSRKNYDEKVAILTQNLAGILEEQIKGEINKIDIALLAIKYEAEMLLIRVDHDKEALRNYLNREHAILPLLEGLWVYDSTGRIINGTGDNKLETSTTIADRDYFIFERDNPKDEIFIAKPVLGRVSKKWVLNIVRRVNNPDGSFAGVVFASINVGHFNKNFSTLNIGKKSAITLRGEELTLIARYPETKNAIGGKTVSKELASIYMSGQQFATYKASTAIDNTERYNTYRKISGYPLYIIVGLATDEYLIDWQKESLIQLGMVVLFTILTILYSRTLISKWSHEKKAGEELVKSNIDLELQVSQRTFDLNHANESLKIELAERKVAEDALFNEKAFLRSLIDSASDLIYFKDLNSIYLGCNKASVEFTGFTEQEQIGKSDYDLFDMEMAENVVKHDRIVFESGSDIRIEERVSTHKGNNFFLDTVKAPIFGLNGQQIGLVGISRDITKQKKEESLLSARAHLTDYALTHTLAELLTEALDKIEDLTGSLIGYFHFLHKDQHSLTLQAWSTRTKLEFCRAEGAGSHYDIDKAGVWVDCIYQRQPVVHNDYASLSHRKGLPDGHATIIREMAVPIFRSNEIVGIIGVGNKCSDYTDEDVKIVSRFADLVWDIAEHKIAGEALYNSESKFRTLFNLIPMSGVIWRIIRDEHQDIVDWEMEEINKLGAQDLGQSSDNLIGKRASAVFGVEVMKQYLELCREVVASNEPKQIETLFVPNNKHYHTILFAIGTCLYANVSFDITDRKTIEMVQVFLAERGWLLQEGDFFQELARFLSETLSIEFVCIDRLICDGMAQTVAVYHNGRFEDNVEYVLKDTPCGDVVGKTICCFPRDVASLFPNDPVLSEINAESYAGITLWGKDEQPIGLIALIGKKPFVNQSLVETVLQYVAPRAAGELERALADEALHLSEEKFSTAFLKGPLMMTISELENGRYLDVNETFLKISGFSREEVIGNTSVGLGWLTVQDRELMVGELAANGRITGMEIKLMNKVGEPVYCLYSGELITVAGKRRLLSMADDITERKRADVENLALEHLLQQAQKMESIGRLAGGVAHDFNNLLTVILGHTQMAIMDTELDHPLYSALEEIRKAAERSAALTSQLLAFARKQVIVPKVIDINDAISGMLNMLQRLIGEDIHLTWHPAPDLWRVKMDSSQIDQIMANLCVNARDAIAGTGNITLATKNVTCEQDFCTQHSRFIPGKYVLLSVNDDGSGMDKETVAHIFEPFYTTKGIGQGTGLGLATVFGIIKQNDGIINVNSEPGRGTVFMLYFPAVAYVPAEVREEKQVAIGGTETILLVEDEKNIMLIGAAMLTRMGYTVFSANSPEEAIQLAEENRGRIDLLVTDIILPGMNGRTLSEKLLEVNPGMKCLFMSGYTADVISERGKIDEGMCFLQKPFTIQTLTGKAREALGS